MNEYFYLDAQNNRQGPVAGNLLPAHGATAETLVWKQGMTDWIPAGQVPELAEYFNVPPQQHAPAAAAPETPWTPQPESYVVWAILATICCCQPLGVVAIAYASQVSTLTAGGHLQAALKASENAKKWSIIACVSGVAVWVVVSIIYGIMGAAMLSTIANM